MVLLWTCLLLMLLTALAILLIPARKHRVTNSQFILLVLIISGLSLLFYWHWGYSQALEQYFAQQQVARATIASQQQVDVSIPQLIQQLKMRLAENKQDANGWYLLGRLYFNQGNFSTAANSFAKATALQNNNPAFLIQYVQAQYLANHGTLSKTHRALLQKVLTLEPDNALGLNLFAVTAYQQGDYQTAIRYWQHLLPRYPSGSTESQALQSGIANAQQKLAE